MHLYCNKRTRLLLILTPLVLFSIFFLYPILDSVITSFYQKTLLRDGVFVGFQNFIDLFHDKLFFISLRNSAIVTGGQLIIVVPVAFFLGYFLSKPYKFTGVFKVASYLPCIFSGVVIGILWFFILDPGFGLINGFLEAVGLESWTQSWIGGMTLTPFSVVLLCAWSCGFYAVLFMAGMKSLPKDAMEAALIDGANSRQRLWYVTIPLLKESLKMVTVLAIIKGINIFQEILMLTGGGPDHQSETLGTYTYYMQFERLAMGMGSAMAVFIFIITMFFAIMVLKLTAKNVDE